MTETSSKFERLMRILRSLATPGGKTARQLADLTGVDVRSIQRDLQFLNEKCFDIVQDRRNGPYRLNRELDIHGQTLTLEEVLSLALGSCVLADQVGELSQQAMQKLQLFIKGDKKLAVRDFPSALAFNPIDEGQRWMPDVMRSLSQHKTVSFRYHAPEATTERKLDPYTLFYNAERWYVQGFDHDRGELRRFRLKRIENLAVEEHTFSLPEGYQSQSALFHKWDLISGPAVVARCRVSEGLAQWLKENPVHPSQSLTEDVLQLEVRNLDALASWILGLTGIEALSPPELRTMLKHRAAAVVALYD